MHIGIVGGGIAGLVAAYELAKSGQRVTLLERASRLGGLAGSFTSGDGRALEKYYHFISAIDKPYLALQAELGIGHCLHWNVAPMGLYYRGALYELGDAISLLRFPHLSLPDKLRFSLATSSLKLTGSEGWRDIEGTSAINWLRKKYGDRTYEILYRPLLLSKFGDDASTISAAWMWARLYRLAKSRSLSQKERSGYLQGGSQTYIDALERALVALGVEIQTSISAERVVLQSGRITGLLHNGTMHPFDCVLSTVPIPYAVELLASCEGPYFQNLRSLEYTGVIVALLRLKQPLSKYFWVNISDKRLLASGVIEYTNLNRDGAGGDSLVYIPRYLPDTDPFYRLPDEEVLEAYCRDLKYINSRFEKSWIRESWVHRDRFAQPICRINFTRDVPSIRTPIQGLFLTDSYQLHPHDRSISGSTSLGLEAARAILQHNPVPA